MTTLAEQRRSLRSLLNTNDPADGVAVYYAFYHPDYKTQLVTNAGPGERPFGYLALSRTGMDLFRPVLTMRLPLADMTASADLIYQALRPETAVIIHAPAAYLPLLKAFFTVQTEEHLQLMELEPARFEPIVNVLVTQSTSANGLPRFIVRSSGGGEQEVVASSALNWQTPYFAEVSVNTDPRYRRRGWGRSVLAAMVQHLLADGRRPLYLTREDNVASLELARAVGFVDSGNRFVMLQATLAPHP